MTKISIFNNSIFLQFYSNWEEKLIEQRKQINTALFGSNNRDDVVTYMIEVKIS